MGHTHISVKKFHEEGKKESTPPPASPSVPIEDGDKIPAVKKTLADNLSISNLPGILLTVVIGVIFIIIITRLLGMGAPTSNMEWLAYLFTAAMIFIALKTKKANWDKYGTCCMTGLAIVILVAWLIGLENTRTGRADSNPFQTLYNWVVNPSPKSASQTQSNAWREVYRKTFTGVGYTGGDFPKYNDGSIKTALAGKDYQIGYRYTVIDSDFENWRGIGWSKFKQGEWLTVNTMTPGDYQTFRNEAGKKFTVVFEKK